MRRFTFGRLASGLWAVALVAALAAPLVARAWGDDGHQIVCEIAWQNLDPAVRERIRELLAGDPDGTFARACSWADRVLRKEDRQFDPYHFVNTPERAPRVPPCEGNCVINGIERFLAVLRDEDAAAPLRLRALKLVGHFVGDVHQPLHAGYRGDRGGSQVRIDFFGQPSNLHRAWDTLILARVQSGWRRYADALAARIRPIDRTLWRGGTPEQWANESYQIVEGDVYEGLPEIDDRYVERARAIIDRRLQAAGVRLAEVLSQALSPSSGSSLPRVGAPAPSLPRVERARFGIWRIGPDATPLLIETREIPRSPGLAFGWSLQLAGARGPVRWREELELPSAPRNAGGAARVRPNLLVREGTSDLEGGRFAQTWVLDAGDPIGVHQIRVYIEGERVATFRFTVRSPAAMAPAPAPASPAPGFDCVPASACCKICSTGKACGNSCISRSYTCRKGRGCSCDAAEVCAR